MPAAIDTQFSDLLQQLQSNYSIQGVETIDPDAMSTAQAYWNKLSLTEKGQYLKFLTQNQNDPTLIRNALTNPPAPGDPSTLKPAADPTNPTGQTAYAAGTPAANQQQGTTAAQQVTGQLGEITTGENGAAGIAVVSPTGAQPAAGSTTPPTGFNQILQQWYGEQFQSAGNDVTQLAQLAGVDPTNLQSQYASYQQSWQKAALAGLSGQVGKEQRQQDQQPLTLAQFAQSKASAFEGPWSAVISAINEVWQGEMYQALPPALIQQIITQLNGLPPDQQQTVLYNAYNYMENAAQAQSGKNPNLRDYGNTNTNALLSSLPSTIMTFSGGSSLGTGSVGRSGVVGTYAQLHPSATLQEQTNQQKVAQAFQTALNRAPTAADITALGSNPTTAQVQQYIDNQPVPGTGMNYGTYNSATGRLDPLWQQYFGKDPTQQQLQWSVGQTTTDLNNYIMNSPSRVKGLTIGKYQDYSNQIQDIQGDLPVAASDDFMSGLHQAVTKK